MTRKHFEAIAQALRNVRGEVDSGEAYSRLCHELANVCAESNPRFGV